MGANTLLLSNAAVSLGGAFVSLEISSQFIIFFSLFSFILAWTFISLQIKEFRIMSLLINDSVYSSLFFFLTGLHFFHLFLGLFLCCLVFWDCIHLEVASNPLCLFINSSWLLVFALCVFFQILPGFNLYCWKGIHFSWSNSLIFSLSILGLSFPFIIG